MSEHADPVRPHMDIPLDADVQCAGDSCGTSVALVLNPTTERVTHVVVRDKDFPHTLRLVPVDRIVEATPAHIALRCAAADLVKMERFIEQEFVPIESPPEASLVSMYAWPVTAPRVMLGKVLVQHEQVPPGELAIHHGARVYDAHGQHVGRVDEFLVDPVSDRITHLVLREGHLWGKKDVTVPVSQIDRIEKDEVYLRLGQQDVEQLPAMPLGAG